MIRKNNHGGTATGFLIIFEAFFYLVDVWEQNNSFCLRKLFDSVTPQAFGRVKNKSGSSCCFDSNSPLLLTPTPSTHSGLIFSDHTQSDLNVP